MRIFEVTLNGNNLAHFDDLETAKEYISNYHNAYIDTHLEYELLKYEITEHVIIDRKEVVFREYKDL